MNEIIEKYINNVKKEFYGLVHADEYLSDLRTNLEEFVRQFPDCSYADLVEQFGAPESAAKEYIESAKPNPPKVRAGRRRKKRILIIIVLIIIAYLLYWAIRAQMDQPSHIEDRLYIEEEQDVEEGKDMLSE